MKTEDLMKYSQEEEGLRESVSHYSQFWERLNAGFKHRAGLDDVEHVSVPEGRVRQACSVDIFKGQRLVTDIHEGDEDGQRVFILRTINHGEESSKTG